MLEIQKYLLGDGTIETLAEKYAISASRHKTIPNLVLFKYSQIESPMSETICQEARGLILDENDNWRVVGQGFSKFFNHLEGNAAKIDWSTASVQEKVDGSLILVYEYKGHWHVATTGSPDASGEVNGFGFTFAELFQHTFISHQTKCVEDASFSEKTIPVSFIDPDICYMFELMTPYNRVVVPHKESKLVLLAARNRVTGEYIENPRIDGIPNVREFPLTSFDDIMATFEHISGLDQEGYVVKDAAGNRVKVKHPQYVALHHLRDNMSPKWFIKVVVSGEVPELLSAFPEYEEEFNKIQVAYETLITNVEAMYESVKDIETQKDYAMAVKDTPYSSILFVLRAGKTPSVRTWLADVKNFASVLRLLGEKEI